MPLYKEPQHENHWHLRKSTDRFREYGSSQKATTLTPSNVELMVYDRLGSLPHFNPELDKQPPPLEVSDFRFQLNSSAGVIISTPEYAHGVPGVLKNALDWLVTSGELYEKPVALFSPSPHAHFVHPSLIETLTVMMARLIPNAFINVLPPSGMADGERLHVCSGIDLPARIKRALGVFAKTIDLKYPESKSASAGDQDHGDQEPGVSPGVQS